MYFLLAALLLGLPVWGARPFLNEPDTGFQAYLGPDFPLGKLPDLKDIWCMHDFEYAARNFLNQTAYAWIRYGTAGEYTYRNNMEIFPRVGFKPRVLTGNSNVNMSMKTTILGNEISAPIFISPAAAPGAVGGYVPEHRELGLIQGAGNGNILYIPALYAEMSIEEMAAAKLKGQVMFQQLYTQKNQTFNQDILDRAKKAGSQAIVWTVDAPADGAWIYGARYTIPPSTNTMTFTWDFYDQLKSMTDLPIILKGITDVEDAKIAASKGVAAIVLSNHGARHLDGAPSPLTVALAIHDQAPEVFQQVEVLADCGVRYGTDVLKYLALGVKAVGLGRSFMYANIYGTPGVERAIELLKREIFLDAVNLGVTDLSQLNASYLDLEYLRTHAWDMW